MIRCLVIDDEPPALAILANYIRQVPFLELVATLTDPVAGLARLQQGHVDLLFLDIQMPRLTGLQLLRLCGPCKVVLTTAYAEYALDGFEHDVVDYLLKPISFERFLRAVSKVRAPLSIPASPPSFVPPPVYFFVKGETKTKYLRVKYSDIIYVESLHNYVILHLPAGQRIITYHTLKEMVELLPRPPFLRVHKSYIVSLDHVRILDGNTIHVHDKELPVGETYREQLYQLVRASRP
ncbi:LytR/AlgR family response regulator transcription factor [Hymenobacter baengnokdamensis]|uniref:LytR/AlgR family response regulator transcription factor n=1 Tax=Hymenobacter baengnokdamensis TaxID=2615203 RepID=UPI00124495F2|nr:LytTR family DNA-binding domain-containing protein [Hymenobacter baengnokdamensis]